MSNKPINTHKYRLVPTCVIKNAAKKPLGAMANVSCPCGWCQKSMENPVFDLGSMANARLCGKCHKPKADIWSMPTPVIKKRCGIICVCNIKNA